MSDARFHVCKESAGLSDPARLPLSLVGEGAERQGREAVRGRAWLLETPLTRLISLRSISPPSPTRGEGRTHSSVWASGIACVGHSFTGAGAAGDGTCEAEAVAAPTVVAGFFSTVVTPEAGFAAPAGSADAPQLAVEPAQFRIAAHRARGLRRIPLSRMRHRCGRTRRAAQVQQRGRAGFRSPQKSAAADPAGHTPSPSGRSAAHPPPSRE